MERTILFSLTAAIAWTASGQLAPQQPAPLFAHMSEVNAEWNLQGPDLATDATPIAFATDADRIAMHLRLVRERLEQHTSERTSAGPRAERIKLLGDLKNYAERGLFPQNHVLPFRNPVFIDPAGTACAVGQLMIASGNAELAHRIDDAMELAYIRDMRWPEIDAWAQEHGFTGEELAWIQPGYLPPIPWIPLGGGTNGPVTVLKDLGNGNMLVAGDFTLAGGIAANNVAIWNGTSYSPMGTGLVGNVNCAAVSGTDIYIGGSFLNGINDLARWDGNQWTFSVVFQGKSPNITALHFHNGDLYAAGEISGFAGIDDLVQHRNGNVWEHVGAIFNGTILSLASHNGSVVAGGIFTGPDNPNDPTYRHVAILQGTSWAQLGDGLDAPVRALLDVNGTLYAGGDLYANVVVTFGLARIGGSGTQWEYLLPDHANYMPTGLGPSWIGALAEHDGHIYFGGEFMIDQMMLYGQNIARFNGTPDDVEPYGGFNGAVNAVAIRNDALVIGGEFDGAIPYVATTDLATRITPSDEFPSLTITPNPASDIVSVQVPLGFKGSVQLIDGSGRIVTAPIQQQTDVLRIDLRALAPGGYMVQLVDGTERIVGRVVKE